MAWYRAGSIAIANGSKNLTGTGTAWVNNAQPGDAVILPDGAYYEVDLVGGNGAITLVESYAGTTVASGGAYKIIPTQGRVRDLAASVLQLIADYGSVEGALTVLAGNLGLGKTPNASARLDVAGQVWVDAPSGDATLRLLTSGTEKGKLAVTSAGRGYLESNGAEVMTWLNGNVGIGTASPTGFGAGYVSLSLNGSTAGVLDLMSSAGSSLRVFSTAAEARLQGMLNVPLTIYTNNTERMRIDASGNVGIGFSAGLPAANAGGSLSAGLVAVRGQLNAHQTSMGVLQFSPGSNLTTLRTYGSTAGSGAFAINVGGGAGATDFESTRFDQNGNVGIGTSTIGAKLDIRGATTALLDIQNTSGLGAQIRLFDTGFSSGISTNSGDLIFGTGGASAERMRLDTGGNFIVSAGAAGAGATSGVKGVQIRFDATNNIGYIQSTQSGVGNFPLALNGTEHRFLIGGSEQAKIDAAGNTRIRLQSVAPTLTDNAEFNIIRISDSVIRFRMRGNDGTTRYADMTLPAS